MAPVTARFPGQRCVECGVEFIPGETQITVHPSKRGPKGGKKYAHANGCGARHNPLRDLAGKRGGKYTNEYVAGSDAAKKLLRKLDPAVVAELTPTAAWGSAQRANLVPRWATDDEDFFLGFFDTMPAVSREASSMASGWDSGDTYTRYNPRVRRNAGRRTKGGVAKKGRLPRMGAIDFLPAAGQPADYHREGARSMSSSQLVKLGTPWAQQELRRRGRGADGVKLAWKR